MNRTLTYYLLIFSYLIMSDFMKEHNLSLSNLENEQFIELNPYNKEFDKKDKGVLSYKAIFFKNGDTLRKEVCNLSFYKEIANLSHDRVATKRQRRDVDTTAGGMKGLAKVTEVYYSTTYGYYKDLRSRNLFIWYYPKNGDKIRIKDTLQTIEWKLNEQKTKKFGQYLCYQAIGHFRGKNYIAWYCPEIPYSHGPWKLWGLPGLILEAYDESGEVNFLFEELDFKTRFDISRYSKTPSLDWRDFHKQLQLQKQISDSTNKISEEILNHPIFNLE